MEDGGSQGAEGGVLLIFFHQVECVESLYDVMLTAGSLGRFIGGRNGVENGGSKIYRIDKGTG